MNEFIIMIMWCIGMLCAMFAVYGVASCIATIIINHHDKVEAQQEAAVQCVMHAMLAHVQCEDTITLTPIAWYPPQPGTPRYYREQRDAYGLPL